jgi:hypothetical protein
MSGSWIGRWADSWIDRPYDEDLLREDPEVVEAARKLADIDRRGPRTKAIRQDVAQRGIFYLDTATIEWIKTLPEGGIRGIISVARDGATHGHLLYTPEMQRKAKRQEQEQAADARTEQKLKELAQREKALREQRALEAGPKPEARLIRTPRDAELAAEAWMRYLGFSDALITPVGADEGIDVNSTKAVAQVKAYMVPVGRPDVQNLAGVAAAEKKIGVFFALSGYTPQAIAWAGKADIALFSFDLQGEPEAVNATARKLVP